MDERNIRKLLEAYEPDERLQENVASDIIGFVKDWTEDIANKFYKLARMSSGERAQTEHRLRRRIEQEGYEVDREPGILKSISDWIIRPLGNVLVKIIRYVIKPDQAKDLPMIADVSIIDVFLLACASIAALHFNFAIAALFLGLKGVFKFTRDMFTKVSTELTASYERPCYDHIDALVDSWQSGDAPELMEGWDWVSGVVDDVIAFFKDSYHLIKEWYDKLLYGTEEYRRRQERKLRRELRARGYDTPDDDRSWYSGIRRSVLRPVSKTIMSAIRYTFSFNRPGDPITFTTDLVLLAAGIAAASLGFWKVTAFLLVMKVYTNVSHAAGGVEESAGDAHSREQVISGILNEDIFEE